MAHAKYDAFTGEARRGIDHIAVGAKDYAPDGELGRAVYDKKVDDGYDVFIPAENYVRIGGTANIGAAGTLDYNVGYGAAFAVGANFSSFVRGEIGWGHSEFAGRGFDYGNMMLWVDFVRRYIRGGDITYRRHIIPFIGVGGIAGAVENAGEYGFAGGARAAAGISFAFTETNAIDAAFAYDYLWGAGQFGIGSVQVSWRSSF